MFNNPDNRNCFSQEGEDTLLERIMGDINYTGSYIDIGAHHPVIFSNTYKFYLSGWRGINIEATPGSIKLFNEIRPLDINLEIPISDKVEDLTFYKFNSPLLNTFSEEHVIEWDGVSGVKVIEKLKLRTTTINSILNKYAIDKNHFDFMSIDVEGFDLRILKTLDFERYSFNFLIVEDKPEIESVVVGDINTFLNSKGYKLVSKLFYSTLYYFDYSSSNGKKILEASGFKGDPESINKSSMASRFINSIHELKKIISKNKKIVLVDLAHWQIGKEIDGREVIPFPEQNGEYWGLPIDDAFAITELKRQFENGATHIIIAWPAFWWLDYYKDWYQYLQSNFSCLLKNENLIVFDLHQN